MQILRLAAAGLLLSALASCTYTFIPLLPQKIQVEERLVVGPGTRFERRDADLVLTVALETVPSEGYLSAFLYRGDDKIGEDSRLITPASTSAQFVFAGAQVGEYRAVLFWGGETLRQVELEVR
jgi:hypothetical protein